MTETTPPFNPYVGPRTFEEKEADRFFGREREARELLALVVSERLTLFYAQSGAGKSSLLNARLIPRLRDEEGFIVLPVGRVSGVLPDGVDLGTVDNIFIYHLIQGLSQRLAEKEAQPARELPELAHTSLAHFLSGETGPDTVADAETPAAADTVGLMPYVLIIDQFEELLTTNPDRWQERAEFFRQLSTAMARHPNLWVVLTLREDYVPSLEPYVPLVPNRLRARFYMQRMGIEAAREAIERPAANAKRPFAEGVAGMLVDNLRLVRVAGQTEYHAGEYVEPVQLQVVCFQLWEDLAGRHATAIDLADLQRLAGGANLAEYVDRALSDFYERAIARVLETPDSGVTEQPLRRWFSSKLITEAGTRSIVFRNETTGKTEGLPNRAVDLLGAQFLLHTELRAGGAWVELAHDRLVEPIRDSNDTWFKKHQSALERQAIIWRDEGKPPDRLLLAGDDLVEAERWAEEHEAELEPHEREFVATSKAARDAADRQLEAEREAARQRELEVAQALAEEQRRRADEQALAAERLRQESRRTRRVAVAALALAVLTIIALAAALAAQINARLSEQKAQAATEMGMAAAATATVAVADARAAVAAEAVAAADARAAATAEAIARGQATESAEETTSHRLAAQAEAQGKAGSMDLALLLGAEALQTADTTAARQAMENLMLSRPEVLTYLYAHDAPVGSLAFSQDGGTLVSSDDAGRLVAWSPMASGRPVSTTIDSGLDTIQAVAADMNPGVLAAGSNDGAVLLWDGEQRSPRPLSGHTGGITDLAFSPDGRFLASASLDGRTMLWPLAEGSDVISFGAGTGPITAIAFDSSSTTPLTLATGGEGGEVRIWTDLETQPRVRDELFLGEVISATVSSLAFDPARAWLAVGFDDRHFTVWDIERRGLIFDPVDAGGASVAGLAFDSQDDSLVVLLADGSLKHYALASLALGLQDQALESWTEPLVGTTGGALASDGRSWAIGLNTGAVMLGRAGEPTRVNANTDPKALIEQACRIANRNLYETEWDAYVGSDVPYRKTCPAIQ